MKILSLLITSFFFCLVQSKNVPSKVRRIGTDGTSGGELGQGLDGELGSACFVFPLLFFVQDIRKAAYSTLTRFGFLDVPFFGPRTTRNPLGNYTFDAQIQEGSGDCFISGNIGLTTPRIPFPPLANTITISGTCNAPLAAITGGTLFGSGASGFTTGVRILDGNPNLAITIVFLCGLDILGLQSNLGLADNDIPSLFKEDSLDLSSEGLASYSNGGLTEYLSEFSSLGEIFTNSTPVGDFLKILKGDS